MSASNRFQDFESTQESQRQVHSRTNVLLALSRLFERSFYYGVRAIVVLYSVEFLEMSPSEAIALYAMLGTVIIVTQIIGGFIGDLWLGNKRMSFIGGLLQVVGSFLLIVPNETALYIGVGLLAVGTGFYSSNFLAVFAKSYFQKLKLLDAGFTLVYGLVNIGSFVGVLFIGLIVDQLGYNAGFGMASLLMMISILFLYLSKFNVEKIPLLTNLKLSSRVLNIVFGVLLFVGFWLVYNLTSVDVRAMDDQFFTLMNDKFFSNFSMRVLNPIVITAGAIGLFALWTFYKIKSSFKMIMGVTFGLLGLVIIHFIGPNLAKDEILIFSLAIAILGIAELLITPIMFSVIAKYTKPKYLATFMGLITVFARISYIIATQFDNEKDTQDTSYLDIGIIILTFLLILGFLFSYMTKSKSTT